MSDLVRVLRGQRIDGRGTDEIMRLAADEIESLGSRLAEAEALLRDIADMRVPVLPSRFMDESMAEAARAFLAADSASVCLHQIHNGDTCEICGAKVTPVVQPERCCLDYPRCDCNSPPEPDDDWLCFQRPAQPKVTP